MATSSRKKAVELWQTQIPAGNREELAKLIFCIENPPGTKTVSGSQDQLGILLPGLNKLNYDNGFWPVSIESVTDDETLNFVAEHLYLIQLPQRKQDYDVLDKTNINRASAKKLADATERCWAAIKAHDADIFGKSMTECFEAQLEMYPAMSTPDVQEAIGNYRGQACGWKLSGAGGGGYMTLIAKKPIPNAIKVVPCHLDN
jgi:galactokinase/mevalonate kinase-like predicted kinase